MLTLQPVSFSQLASACLSRSDRLSTVACLSLSQLSAPQFWRTVTCRTGQVCRTALTPSVKSSREAAEAAMLEVTDRNSRVEKQKLHQTETADHDQNPITQIPLLFYLCFVIYRFLRSN